MTEKDKHHHFMELALDEARKAETAGEVPIGAILIDQDETMLASTHNQTITLNDPSAHAEILALRKAGKKCSNYRLLNTTLYVTIEPCIMCMGAIINARVSCVVYGAKDPKWGAAGSLYDLQNDERLNHQVDIIAGVCEEQARHMLQSFFREKRKKPLAT